MWRKTPPRPRNGRGRAVAPTTVVHSKRQTNLNTHTQNAHKNPTRAGGRELKFLCRLWSWIPEEAAERDTNTVRCRCPRLGCFGNGPKTREFSERKTPLFFLGVPQKSVSVRLKTFAGPWPKEKTALKRGRWCAPAQHKERAPGRARTRKSHTEAFLGEPTHRARKNMEPCVGASRGSLAPTAPSSLSPNQP